MEYLYNTAQSLIKTQRSIQQYNHITNHQSTKQARRKKYYKFFSNVIHDKYIIPKPTQEDFKKHKMRELSGNQKLQSYSGPYISIKYTQKQASIVVYTVIIAMFELQIVMLNIDKQADQKINIARGTFAEVRIQQFRQRMLAVKRQSFRQRHNLSEFKMMANNYQINEIISQLAIYKICSLFKIGLAVETEIGFDLICYNDCIEFYTELGMKINHKSKNYVYIQKFQKEMKQNLLILHRFNIIHKDIKPHNILYSTTYNRYVFIDFGISNVIKQSIGERSQTYREGTYQYMSEEMQDVKLGEFGLVDLYNNDVFALQIVLSKPILRQIFYQQIDQSLVRQRTAAVHSNSKLKYGYIQTKTKGINEKNMNRERRNSLQILAQSRDEEKAKALGTKTILELSRQNDIKRSDLKLSELNLKNMIKIQGYCQEVKDMIYKLKLESKYQKTLNKINSRIMGKSVKLNYIDLVLRNNNAYICRIKQQLKESQGKQAFDRYMILLSICEDYQKYQIILKLRQLDYKRSEEENIQEQIRITHFIRTKQKLIQFGKIMDSQKVIVEKIVDKYNLNKLVASIYQSMNQSEFALYYYAKQLKYDLLTYGKYHRSISSGYTNQANIYIKEKKYQAALEHYEVALEIDKNLYGQEHSFIASNYYRLGILYKLQNDFNQALKYYQKSSFITIKFFGESHPEMVKNYNSIGNLYHLLQKYNFAIECYKKCIKIVIDNFTQNNYQLASIYNNLALSYYSVYSYKRSIQYYQKSIAIDNLHSIQENIIQAQKYSQIAVIYEKIQQFDMALRFYFKSIKINIKYYGQGCKKAIANLFSICELYHKNRREQKILDSLYQTALTYFKTSLDLYEPVESEQVTNIYDNVFNAYLNLKQPQPKIAFVFKYLKRILLIIRKSMPKKILVRIFKQYQIMKQNKQIKSNIKTKILNVIRKTKQQYQYIPKFTLIKLLLKRKKILIQLEYINSDICQFLKNIVKVLYCYKYLNYEKEKIKLENELKQKLFLSIGQLWQSNFMEQFRCILQ